MIQSVLQFSMILMAAVAVGYVIALVRPHPAQKTHLVLAVLGLLLALAYAVGLVLDASLPRVLGLVAALGLTGAALDLRRRNRGLAELVSQQDFDD